MYFSRFSFRRLVLAELVVEEEELYGSSLLGFFEKAWSDWILCHFDQAKG